MSASQLDMFEAPPRAFVPPIAKPKKLILIPRRLTQAEPTPPPPKPKQSCQWIQGEARRGLKCEAPVMRSGCAWCEKHYRVVYRPTKPIEV